MQLALDYYHSQRPPTKNIEPEHVQEQSWDDVSIDETPYILVLTKDCDL